MSDKPVVQNNVFGAPDSEPVVIAVDMAGGIDQSFVARLRTVCGGTAIEIIEMQRSIQPVIDKMAKILDEQIFTGIAAMSVCLIDGNLKVKEIPSWRFCKPVQLPQWQPPIRRPQQRSTKMRKHARIVRSRMTPNERRRKQAQWDRMKRLMRGAGILNPNASDLWKNFL